jgi:hypothetical protein
MHRELRGHGVGHVWRRPTGALGADALRRHRARRPRAVRRRRHLEFRGASAWRPASRLRSTADSLLCACCAVLCMQVSDIWGPVTPPIVNGQHFNTWLAAKRALYIVLQHAELAVDMVVEEDIGPTLNTYRMIVLADTHVSKKGSSALAAWVAAGGVLFATAGAGAFDELVRSPTSTANCLPFPAPSLPPRPTRISSQARHHHRSG